MTAAQFRAGHKAAAGKQPVSGGTGSVGGGRRLNPRPKAQDTGPISPLPFKVTLPFLPPSVNKLFCGIVDKHSGVAKRSLTKAARETRRNIMALVHGRLDPTLLYTLQVDVYLRAFTKKGKVRRVDLTNRIKFLEDCVCAALGVDDSRIFRVVLNKLDSQVDSTVVIIDRFASPPPFLPAAGA